MNYSGCLYVQIISKTGSVIGKTILTKPVRLLMKMANQKLSIMALSKNLSRFLTLIKARIPLARSLQMHFTMQKATLDMEKVLSILFS